MNHIVEIGSPESVCDRAFAELCHLIGSLYERYIADINQPLYGEDGQKIVYEDVYITCTAYGLIKFKEQRPRQYQLLIREAGDEMSFINHMLYD